MIFDPFSINNLHGKHHGNANGNELPNGQCLNNLDQHSCCEHCRPKIHWIDIFGFIVDFIKGDTDLCGVCVFVVHIKYYYHSLIKTRTGCTLLIRFWFAVRISSHGDNIIVALGLKNTMCIEKPSVFDGYPMVLRAIKTSNSPGYGWNIVFYCCCRRHQLHTHTKLILREMYVRVCVRSWDITRT